MVPDSSRGFWYRADSPTSSTSFKRQLGIIGKVCDLMAQRTEGVTKAELREVRVGIDLAQVFSRGAIALVVVAIFVVVALNTGNDAASLLNSFSVRFLSIFIEAAPFLLLGSIVSGLISTFVSKEQITRLVPRNPFMGVLVGTFLGFAFPVCECGVVPVVRQLYSKSLPISVGVSFLLAAPVMNPIVFFSTYTAFGFGPVLIGRFVITAVVAAAVGSVFALIARRTTVLLPGVSTGTADMMFQPASMAPVVAEAEPRPSVRAGLGRSLVVAGDEFYDMGRFLIIGCVLAAALQTLISQDTLLALGKGPILSIITMEVFAFVLSVCSTVDAFLALAFASTFTTGSILAFLTFGPMVDIKSTLMFLGIFRRKIVVLLIFLPFLMTMVISLILNLLNIG